MAIKRGKAKRLHETFRASVWCVQDVKGVYAYLDVNSPRLANNRWIDGDRVRVTVERIAVARERGERKVRG